MSQQRFARTGILGPPMNEKDFMADILELAKMLHWTRAHFRPALTKRGWVTPVQGDGAGFPDLILIRPPRLIAAELKSQDGRTSKEQEDWLDLFGRCQSVEAYLWRPDDLEKIAVILQ